MASVLPLCSEIISSFHIFTPEPQGEQTFLRRMMQPPLVQPSRAIGGTLLAPSEERADHKGNVAVVGVFMPADAIPCNLCSSSSIAPAHSIACTEAVFYALPVLLFLSGLQYMKPAIHVMNAFCGTRWLLVLGVPPYPDV